MHSAQLDVLSSAPTDWPDADKEALGHCPICGSGERSVLHADVRDGVFGVPGAWTLWNCTACSVAYLDPRPSTATIARAYLTYYTHDESGETGDSRSARLGPRVVEGIIRLRDELYIRFLWSDRSLLAKLLSPVLRVLAPRPIAAIACKLRHLKPARHAASRLLDIGCGNGAFLPMAERLGYLAIGIDPDPAAVAQGAAQGRNVSVASMEAIDFPSGSFEHVMLAHVFEHLHDTSAALHEVYRLLAPGGRVWILQPNLGAIGHTEFGPDWRGLEVPRHLTLMKPSRLLELLEAHGFVRAELKKPTYEADFYYRQSLDIRERRTGGGAQWSRRWKQKVRAADTQAFANPAVCESMTVVAFKPSSGASRQ